VGAAPCTALCNAGQDPCTVATVTCDSPADFDLGGRALSIPAGTTLTVNGGDGNGILTITGARSVSIAGTITALGAQGEGGQIFIASAGSVTLPANSVIDVSSDGGDGLINIDVQTGDITASGVLDAHAGKNGSGGDVLMTTEQGGNIVVDGTKIDTSSGGDLSDGGDIDLEAADSLSVAAALDLSASCGGDLTLVGGTGNVTLQGSGVLTSGSGLDGCSGGVTITAGGNVAIHAPITLRGPSVDDIIVSADGSIDSNAAGVIDASDTLPGDVAGQISFTATGAGSVTLHGDITATANGDRTNGGGAGAELDAESTSGSVEIAGAVDVSCSGAGAQGGIVMVQAGLDFTLSGPIQAGTGNSSTGTGGEVGMSAQRFGAVASSIDVHGGTTGGTIALTSSDSLMVLGDDEANNPVMLVADGTGAQAEGGNITLTACSLSLFHDAVVSSLGTGTFPAAGNLLQGTMQLKVDAKLKAGSANRLEYRDVLPVIGPFASISPAADIELNPGLLCCDGVACAPTSTTTTSTTTSTTAQVTTSTAVTTTVPSSSPLSTSTTSTPSTSAPTTSSPGSATTSTTIPTSCLDQPLTDFDGVACPLEILSDMLQSQPPDALGGPKSARMLKAKIGQALHLVETARTRTKRKSTALLGRAKQVVKSFRALAKRGMRRHRIDGGVGGQLLTLADVTTSRIDALRAAQRTGGP